MKNETKKRSSQIDGWKMKHGKQNTDQPEMNDPGFTDSVFQDKVAKFSKLLSEAGTKEIKTNEETLLNIKAFNNIEDPPICLEQFMQCPSNFRKQTFFENLKINNVIIGKLAVCSASGWTVKLLGVMEGQKRWIKDLQITARLVITKSYDDDVDEDYEVGDLVKALVEKVDVQSKDIWLTLEPSVAAKSQYQLPKLGKIQDPDTVEYLLESREFDEENDSAYLEHIRDSSLFNHPHGVSLLASHFNVNQDHHGFVVCNTLKIKETALELREKQMLDWSMSMVGIGVKHFREKNLKEAKKCLDKALSFYPKNVEGFVARGALKANQSDLKGAIDDFRKALEVNPHHRNGKKYLIETSLSLARSHEKEKRWKESSKCYHEIMKHDPDHKEAKERYHQIHQILSSKIISGREAAKNEETSSHRRNSASSKTKDRIEQLKRLLQEDTNKNSSSSSSTSSSSSSSSESESESNSSSGEDWIEKTNSKSRKRVSDRKRRSHHKHYSSKSRKNRKRSRKSSSQSPERHSRKNLYETSETSRKERDFKSTHEPGGASNLLDNNALDKDAKQILRKLKDFSSEEIDIVKKMLRKNESAENTSKDDRKVEEKSKGYRESRHSPRNYRDTEKSTRDYRSSLYSSRNRDDLRRNEDRYDRKDDYRHSKREKYSKQSSYDQRD